mmetsp:Transcript_64999/g.89319  ORF Transcript_64999/g.89319 Transcript_64999/m.89319 type:complete len:366 (-) Transcript_64999:253-1350(-)|eukprot:CAMPEP_0185753628 /NCGR_PEP_ID=MMETSP1174-20130828/12352_1 /TAXON_ID=35687 /ORGANISM="Dictyocha speculum, Strain CCMP1381" /LENGTH=365 /DNA_ID=CAMNT_0028431561 /DNA_START=92 /DNA_END=1189 /DNA_ORIENTATION=+
MNVPPNVRDVIDTLARELETRDPTSKPATEGIAALDGRWRVRFSDAPPPSNGALGPFVGEAYQVVDVLRKVYSNQLMLGPLNVTLSADFRPRDDRSLRVAFKTLDFAVLGQRLFGIRFPEGTERTWLLSYTDTDTRIVRAGVDGGRSTARELGLIDSEEGQNADAYLFVMTRAPPATMVPPMTSFLGKAAQRRMLKEALVTACQDENLGASTSTATRATIVDLMEQLSFLNPTLEPARSSLLKGKWEIVWTTEKELLLLTDKGLLGLPCTGVSQRIYDDKDERLGLVNRIDFDGDGFISVSSTCSPDIDNGQRVEFSFESCRARWKGIEVPLPPVGSGWFDIIYMDQDLRVCKDVRGDLQVCKRG